MTTPVLHQKAKKILIRLFLFVVGMVVVMLCRETGVADAHWFQFHVKGRHEGKQKSIWDMERSVRGVNFEFFQDLDHNGTNSGIFLSLGNSGNLFKKLSQPQTFRENNVTIFLDRIDVKVDGAYWLPIRKSAECVYVVTYRVIAPDQTLNKGKLEGKLTCTGVGISSTRCFLEAIDSFLLKEIKTDLVKYLREHGAKKST
jgi:hypothetical protein